MPSIDELSPELLEELVNNGKLQEYLAQNQPAAPPSQPFISVTTNSYGHVDSVLAAEAPPQPAVNSSSSNETLTPSLPDGFDIKDPLELLMLLDPDVSSGRVTLYPWQVQYMIDFADEKWTDVCPFQSLVQACNGSGKDKYIIAPCAVWLGMRHCEASSVITSSSGVQLDNQTDSYIKQLCEAANRHPLFLAVTNGKPVWKINYRYYECLPTKSPLFLYATDEPGKAEGYHPLRSGAKMGLFQSEAKTVPDEINVAMNKCTGYTHRAHVSTPGLPMGHFFDYCSTARLRADMKDVYDRSPIDYIKYHVTAYDCPHLVKTNYIEQMKRDLPGGESGAAFKSQVLAEFGTTDEMVVIPYTYVWKSMNKTPAGLGHLKDQKPTGGLDLSAGGDETVFAVRNGNKLTHIIPFKFDNTQDSIEFLEEKFTQHGFKDPSALIWADAGGLGKPIIDDLRRRGWSNIRYVTNQSTAYQDRVYANRGAEMWFNFGKLLESNELWLLNDNKLSRQLATRYYKITPANKHQLESKLQARAKGHPSPDRADAVVLCFSDYKTKLEQPTFERPYKEPAPETTTNAFDMKEWASRGTETKEKSLNPSRHLNFRGYKAVIARYNEELKLQRNN